MVYSEAQKQATYRYRAKVRDTPAFKEKVRLYTARGWERKKEDPDRIARKREYERDAYHRQPDRILVSIRWLFDSEPRKKLT